jgi:hypothetical protein
MLTIICPRVVRALVAGRRRSQRRAAWGSFSQRTIDRRYCGLPTISGPFWFATACQLAGGVPSPLVWVPFGAAQVRQSVALCHFCAGPIDAASRCACFGHA